MHKTQHLHKIFLNDCPSFFINVVYEVAESVDHLVDNTDDKQADKKHIVKHKDPQDKAKTLVVRPKTLKNPMDALNAIKLGRLRTTVKVEDKNYIQHSVFQKPFCL